MRSHRHTSRSRLRHLPTVPGLALLLAQGCGAPDAEEARAPTAAAGALAGGYAAPGSLVGGDVVLLPQPQGLGSGAHALGVNGRHILYLNFEGAEVWSGNDAEAHYGTRGLMTRDMIEMPPYAPGDASRYRNILEIHKRVAGWYGNFNIDVVLSRPLSSNYQMTLVGGDQATLGFPDGVVGISPGDCRNANPSDLNFAFSAKLGGNPFQTAITIAHEAGHAFGLGHTQNKKDIMYPSVQTGADMSFATGEAADPGVCNVMQGFVQDGQKVLSENLGPRKAEAGMVGQSAPTVAFVSVPDHSEVMLAGKTPDTAPVAADLVLAAKASAKSGVDHITFSISPGEGGRFKGGFAVAELRPPASSAQVRFSAPGEYLLQAAAYDREGNAAVAYSRVKVATPTCAAPNDCTPGQRCMDSVCVTPAPPAAADGATGGTRPLGTTCTGTNECAGPGAFCAVTAIGQICTNYCSDGRRCGGGLSCVDGVCQPPTVARGTPEARQLGARCSRTADCDTGLECSPASESDPLAPRYCTRECDGQVAWACPADMVCQSTTGASGQKDRCVLGAKAAEAQGCQVGAGAGRAGAAGPLSFGALLLLLAARLRRRSARAA